MNPRILFSRSYFLFRSIKSRGFANSFPRRCFSLSSLNSRLGCTSPLAMPLDRTHYMLPNDQPVVVLDCQPAFNALSNTEKLYAHYLSQASWNGGLIVLVQTSPESPLIFVLLHKLFSSQSIPELKEIALEKCNFSEDDFQGLLVYTSGILTNMGNYKGFGDSKFVPNLTKEKLGSLIKLSKSYQNDQQMMEFLWTSCGDSIFDLDEKIKQLGFKEKGVTTYFSSNCIMKDAEFINEFLKSKNLEAYNNRAFKTSNENGVSYEVRFASVASSDELTKEVPVGKHVFKGIDITVTVGDYSKLLQRVNKNLTEAMKYAANETEKNMIAEYIRSFQTGSLDAHKEGSRFWIKDKGPVVETYIGFIETYRDPAGQRGEFEGFVAMVNKEMSAKFSKLVDNAETFLPHLPWPSAFEKDHFLRPDFTSLDVLTFSGSGIPAGINIPNYDEIRQSEGFKNVSLGNVIPASYKETVTPFLSKTDQVLLDKYRIGSFEVQVGLHELLGHGSGKLFFKNKDGTMNFDATLVNPLTGKPINSFYEEGETYDSKFLTTASAYEECRAEAVGLFLSLNRDVLKIFGYEGEEANNIIYVNWLNLLLSALRGLEMFQPDAGVWGQAHSRARYVILQVFLEAGENFVTVKEAEGADGKPDLILSLDRSKIESVGKNAISNFLQKLQVYKSTADVSKAEEMFNRYSAVTAEGDTPFLKYRNIVVDRRQPRKMFVQANTSVTGDSVTLKNYEPTHAGLIQSWVDRFPNMDSILVDLWKKDKDYFN